MSWRALTETDLKTRLSGSELSTFRTVARDANDSDPVQGVLDQVTDLVRGYIAGSTNNRLGVLGTVPTKLIGPAVALAVMEVMARSGGKVLDLGEHRRASAKDALNTLRDVAADRFRIDVPDVQTAEQTAFISPTMDVNRLRQFGFDREDGI